MRTRNLLVALFIFLSILAGCGQTAVSTPTLTPPPSPTPLPTSDIAIVNEVDLRVEETTPIQISAIVAGDLRNDCEQIDTTTQKREGNTITVNLATRYEGDACTQALVPFVETIPLDVAGLPAGSYLVNVNGVINSFIFTRDNVEATAVPPTPTAEPEPTAAAPALAGVVWHDLCASTGGDGCTAREDGTFVANGQQEEDEPLLADVTVSLRRGACPSSEEIATTTTNDQGQYQFAETLEAGEYCVMVDSLLDANAPSLIPGAWTTPTDGMQTVTISADNTTLPNFGWDYQLLPAPPITNENCTDIASFVGDVTIPDDTPFEPKTQFDKTWRFINSGNCVWDENYRLRFFSGDQMGAPDEFPLPKQVVSGQTIDVTIPFTTPEKTGTYRGDWQLIRPDDTVLKLGDDTVWLQIVVIPANTFASVSGRLWDDACDSREYKFGSSEDELPSGCLLNLNGTVRGDGLLGETEKGIKGVTVTLGQGECGDSEPYLTTSVTDDGSYTFGSVQPDTVYCVYVEVASPDNAAILMPGLATFPAVGAISHTITPKAGDDLTDLNFGWDFAE